MRCSPCNLVFTNINNLKQHEKKSHPPAFPPCEKCKTPLNTFNEMLSHVKSCKLSPLRSSTPSKDDKTPSDLNDKSEPRDQLVVSEDEGEGNREVQPDNPAVDMGQNVQENEDAEEFVNEEGEVDFAERSAEDTEGKESSDDENSRRCSRSDGDQKEDNKSQEEAENLKDNDEYQNLVEDDENLPDVDGAKSVLQEWFENVEIPWEDSTKSSR